MRPMKMFSIDSPSILTTRKGRRMYCERCNHTGLIPSLVLGKFSGKPIPNCFTKCECNQDEPDHYREITPVDFDFTVSWDFHRFICEQYGKGDPGPDEVPKTSEDRSIVPTPEKMPNQQRLDRLEGNLISLRDILKQHANEQKGKKRTGQY